MCSGFIDFLRNLSNDEGGVSPQLHDPHSQPESQSPPNIGEELCEREVWEVILRHTDPGINED